MPQLGEVGPPPAPSQASQPKPTSPLSAGTTSPSTPTKPPAFQPRVSHFAPRLNDEDSLRRLATPLPQPSDTVNTFIKRYTDDAGKIQNPLTPQKMTAFATVARQYQNPSPEQLKSFDLTPDEWGQGTEYAKRLNSIVTGYRLKPEEQSEFYSTIGARGQRLDDISALMAQDPNHARAVLSSLPRDANGQYQLASVLEPGNYANTLTESVARRQLRYLDAANKYWSNPNASLTAKPTEIEGLKEYAADQGINIDSDKEFQNYWEREGAIGDRGGLEVDNPYARVRRYRGVRQQASLARTNADFANMGTAAQATASRLEEANRLTNELVAQGVPLNMAAIAGHYQAGSFSALPEGTKEKAVNLVEAEGLREATRNLAGQSMLSDSQVQERMNRADNIEQQESWYNRGGVDSTLSAENLTRTLGMDFTGRGKFSTGTGLLQVAANLPEGVFGAASAPATAGAGLLGLKTDNGTNWATAGGSSTAAPLMAGLGIDPLPGSEGAYNAVINRGAKLREDAAAMTQAPNRSFGDLALGSAMRLGGSFAENAPTAVGMVGTGAMLPGSTGFGANAGTFLRNPLSMRGPGRIVQSLGAFQGIAPILEGPQIMLDQTPIGDLQRSTAKSLRNQYVTNPQSHGIVRTLAELGASGAESLPNAALLAGGGKLMAVKPLVALGSNALANPMRGVANVAAATPLFSAGMHGLTERLNAGNPMSAQAAAEQRYVQNQTASGALGSSGLGVPTEQHGAQNPAAVVSRVSQGRETPTDVAAAALNSGGDPTDANWFGDFYSKFQNLDPISKTLLVLGGGAAITSLMSGGGIAPVLALALLAGGAYGTMGPGFGNLLGNQGATGPTPTIQPNTAIQGTTQPTPPVQGTTSGSGDNPADVIARILSDNKVDTSETELLKRPDIREAMLTMTPQQQDVFTRMKAKDLGFLERSYLGAHSGSKVPPPKIRENNPWMSAQEAQAFWDSYRRINDWK